LDRAAEYISGEFERFDYGVILRKAKENAEAERKAASPSF
jgi:hypothetical protein